jgi:hypothetical protein
VLSFQNPDGTYHRQSCLNIVKKIEELYARCMKVFQFFQFQCGQKQILVYSVVNTSHYSISYSILESWKGKIASD